jgi:hypothetical protein
MGSPRVDESSNEVQSTLVCSLLGYSMVALRGTYIVSRRNRCDKDLQFPGTVKWRDDISTLAQDCQWRTRWPLRMLVRRTPLCSSLVERPSSRLDYTARQSWGLRKS